MLGEFASVLSGLADCLIICLRKPKITATTITKYIEYLEDGDIILWASLIKEHR